MPVRYILVDLDKTIYPAESALMPVMDDLMTHYVADRLGVSPVEAARLRRESFPRYGTTLRWLIEEKGLEDPEDFLAATHPKDVAPHLIPVPELREALASIPLPMSILTNSTREHAERVLAFYGVRDQFQRIFDLRFNAYRGKPEPRMYQMVLDALGERPQTTLFVDDHPLYLEAFRDMGGQVLLVAPTGHDGMDRIDRITALPDYLRRRG